MTKLTLNSTLRDLFVESMELHAEMVDDDGTVHGYTFTGGYDFDQFTDEQKTNLIETLRESVYEDMKELSIERA
jgi:hypothetical protein